MLAACPLEGLVSGPVPSTGALALHEAGLPRLSPHEYLASGGRSQPQQSPSFHAPWKTHAEAVETKPTALR
jgi:hypothetical protein